MDIGLAVCNSGHKQFMVCREIQGPVYSDIKLAMISHRARNTTYCEHSGLTRKHIIALFYMIKKNVKTVWLLGYA